MTDNIDAIISEAIQDFMMYENITYTSLDKDYLFASVVYNNQTYSFIDCETKFGDITRQQFVPRVKQVFLDWLHYEGAYNKQYHC